MANVCTPIWRFKFNLPQELLKQFYSAIIESVLCSSITVWFGSAAKTVYNRQSGLPRGLSVALCTASKNVTPPEWGKRAKKVTLDTSHPAHSLSLNCCPHAGHISPEQLITHPSTVNNSSNLHPYIGHKHIHSSVYSHFSFLYIFILLLLLFIIIAYSLHY